MGNLETILLGAAGIALGAYTGAGAVLTGLYALAGAYIGNYTSISKASKAGAH